MELYGLSSVLSDEIFGDPDSFLARYTQGKPDIDGLRIRLEPLCKRTLRREVTQYIDYRQRLTLTFRFRASEDEHRLYEAVSDYLRREDSFALPSKGRGLIEILIWKLLASSPRAIAGTLEQLRTRLIEKRKGLDSRIVWL